MSFVRCIIVFTWFIKPISIYLFKPDYAGLLIMRICPCLKMCPPLRRTHSQNLSQFNVSMSLHTARYRLSPGKEWTVSPSPGKWTWGKPAASWRSRISSRRTRARTSAWRRTPGGWTQWKGSSLSMVGDPDIHAYLTSVCHICQSGSH